MASSELKANIKQKNSRLRDQYTRLKSKKDQITSQLQTILRRHKQINQLKQSLISDYNVAIQKAKIYKNKKIAYIGILEGDIRRLEEEFIVATTQFKKFQNQYQVCLRDYDDILKAVTEEIELCKLVEADIVMEREGNSSMKAMIFDYERLKRVLEQQRKYFKQLSNSQQKSHEQRVTQLQKILQKLKIQQKQSEDKQKLFKFRSGLNYMHRIFKSKIKQYSQFLRKQMVFSKKAELGVKVFRNCIQIANLKHKLSTRKLFYQWHHNVFPKSTLRNLVQETTINDMNSLKRLTVLNKMTQIIYDKNLAIFHLYEKGKYLSIISNKVARKDLHYGFNRWRQNYYKKNKCFNLLLKVLGKVIPNCQKRGAFKAWKRNANLQTRIILANHLLNQYMQTRQMCRVFRKWRFQLSHHQIRSVQRFNFNMKLLRKISSKINYEKRKTKALTSLAFKLQKIKLRNYFIKYWTNIKSLTIQKQRDIIKKHKQEFSEFRAQQKVVINQVQKKNKQISLKAFRAFMVNSRLKPYMKKWRNTAIFLKERSYKMHNLALRKQYKLKIFVMNQFRKCVQYFQKKQMHQVLTDLNNKMQAINQKSTDFRQKLKKCIQDLGMMASKKIQISFNYSLQNQQKLFFHIYLRKKIRKLYKQYILFRFDFILNKFGSKTGFNQISLYSKDKAKQLKLQKAQKIFFIKKQKMICQKTFYALKGMLNANKRSFRLMGHSENIIMFYRMACAFVALQRKNNLQKIKNTNKKIVSNQAILKSKNDNIENLQQQKRKLEQSLRKIFMKFVNFQDRNLQLKQKRNILQLTKRYFSKYRQNVQEKIYAEKVIIHFSEFISQKNKMIFWKGANAIKFQNIIATVKQQLSKINKKKKAFQQKNQKGRGDIVKRLDESSKVHSTHFQYYDYYLKKFENTLKFYQQRHFKNQKQLYARQIFRMWKRQYYGAKKLALGINRVLQRNLVHVGCQQIIKFVKKSQSQFKSQQICAQVLQRKARNSLKDAITLWRCNIRKLKCQKLQIQANSMIQSRQMVADDCKIKGGLVAQQRLRLRRKKMLAACFMAFKTQVTEKIYEQRYKVQPFRLKLGERYLRTAINGFKWLMFYKKTKRSYLKYKKQKFQKQLKSDVFLVLKIYRQQHYSLVNKVQGIYDNIKNQYMRFALDKILNLGAYNRDELNYQRRRALRHLVMNKVTKVYLIKRKLMAKWRAWLIPRTHYLPNILKSLQVTFLRKYFANIRQHAYWNPIYIKKAADNITSQGYSQINSATNNLVKQGFDPQQIKQYLANKNEKDTKNIKVVVNRMKIWGGREMLVRAWNSWRQYLVLKKKIRKSLSKVFNIVEGLGRYWNRWRSKDPKFNAILQKESRGNMLQRYRDLGRLLKQYKRDVKDSKVYCQQLRDINDQYAQKNQQGIKMALSVLSNNLKKGMKQSLQIWRSRLRTFKKQQVDQRFDQLSQGISILVEQRNKLKYKLIAIQQQNKHMKQKCNLGKQCGQILQKLLKERDSLSIDLADKQHNMKLLLEDNLRLKQKIRSAKQNAEKLINKVQNYQGSD